MKKNQKHIVFLSRWYPSPCDNMLGLFTERHAELMSSFFQVSVIYPSYCTNVKTGIFTKVKNNVINVNINISYQNKMIKWVLFFLLHLKAYRYVISKYGKPSLTHVHVLTREGVIALYFKWFYGIPYVITEHWSRYLFNKPFKNFLHRLITHFIVKQANAISTPSETLQKAMLSKGLGKGIPFMITHNVINDDVFTIVNNIQKINTRKILLEKFTYVDSVPVLVNISVFEEKSKNLSGLLKALYKIKKKGKAFTLILVGYGQDFDKIKALADDLDLLDHIYFAGEVKPNEVAYYLQASDFYVQPSNYETGGLAVAEAMMCGLPVVVTDLPVFKEFIDSSCGYMVKLGKIDELSAAIELMLEDFWQFDKNYIRKKAQHFFSPKAVAQEFLQLYSYVFKTFSDENI